jgi:predicted Zn-dependent protease with MMP-like domain
MDDDPGSGRRIRADGPVAQAAPDPSRRVRRRRDRRGRGLRGRLAERGVPLNRSRAEKFDDMVLDAVEHLEQRWSRELHGVEFAVEEVPPADPTDEEAEDPVPLSRLQPASGTGRLTTPPRIVLYRRPLEARAMDAEDLGDLVLDVVVHEVAHLLDVEPEIVDPEGHGFLEE